MADNFTYDVFLVSALEDTEFADTVAKRLRGLKMKVWFDKKREGRTFDSKDARSAEKARNMLVLWSKHADESDWVHAAARTGRSRDILVQTAIDDVVPRDPFSVDERIDLGGLTARKTVPGYLSLVGVLGAAQGRKNLDKFAELSAQDREAWYKKNKQDPLSLADAAKKEAALPYLSEMRSREEEWANWRPEQASGLPAGVPDDLALVGGIADRVKEAMPRFGVKSLADLSMLDDDKHVEIEGVLKLRKEQVLREEWVEQARELLDGKPPRAKVDLALWTRSQEEHAAALAAPVAAAAMSAPVYAEPTYHEAAPVAAMTAAPDDGDYIKVGILTAILSAIALMFLLGWLFGKTQRAEAAYNLVNACPAGEYPVSLDPIE